MTVDWLDVEPARGRYDVTDLTEQLATLAASAAYDAMLDEVLPTFSDHGVWLLAIANEPPLDDSDFDGAGFATFVENVVSHVHDVAPDLAVTFTFTGTDVLLDEPGIDRLIDAVDVVSVNHYCLGSDLLVEPLEQTDQPIDAVVRAAQERPVVF